MIKLIYSGFKYFAFMKNFMYRANTYLALINSVIIILTFKQVYEIDIPAFVFVIVMAVLGLIIGLIDYFFVLKHEMAHINKQNDLKKDLEEIKQLLKDNLFR